MEYPMEFSPMVYTMTLLLSHQEPYSKYMANCIDNGKAKDVANDMANYTGNGLVKAKVTTYLIAVTQ